MGWVAAVLMVGMFLAFLAYILTHFSKSDETIEEPPNPYYSDHPRWEYTSNPYKKDKK